MSWRQVRYLLNAEVQSSDDATKILKLPLSNVIHTMYLQVKATTGSTNAQDLSIDDVVDKIEVIANGSQVILSLTPQEARQWALLDQGQPITEVVDESAGAVMQATYPLMFGFNEWDDNYWLPCSKFTDLELRIKYSPTVAVTGWVTGTVTMTIIALMTMGGDPGSYNGTLRKTTIYDYTTAASGDEVIDLPRRLLYNRGLLYCYEAGIEDGIDITDVKLSLNSDERIPLDMDWNDLQEWNRKIFDINSFRTMKINRANNDVVHTHISRIQSAMLHPMESADITADQLFYGHVDAIAGDALTLDNAVIDVTAGAEDLTADATDRDFLLKVEGLGLPYVAVIPFAYLNGNEFFDPTTFDMLQLILTNGAAGGDAKLSLEEILVLS